MAATNAVPRAGTALSAEIDPPVSRSSPAPRRPTSGPRHRARTDEDERRARVRAGREAPDVDFVALEPGLSPFGRYLVALDGRPVASGCPVEFRSFTQATNACECRDFRIDRLGTREHLEALRHHLAEASEKRPVRWVTEIFVDRRETPPILRFADLGSWRAGRLPDGLAPLGVAPRYTPERAVRLRETLRGLPPGHRDLLSLPVDLYPFDPVAERVWALRHDLSSYDAWYVALAESMDAPLATLDERLVNAPGSTCEFVSASA